MLNNRPLPFVVLAEIIPHKVTIENCHRKPNYVGYKRISSIFQIRDVGTTICMTSISFFAFITMKTFPPLVSSLGLYSVMYIYCAVAVFGVIFGVFVVEETKGKNLNKLDEN